METNVIVNGDSVEYMRSLPDGCVDCVFADPPYWMRVDGVLERAGGGVFDGCVDEWDQFSSLEEYEGFTRGWLSECYRVLKPNGSIWVIGGMQCIYTIGAIMQQLGFWFINDVVWAKTNPTPNFRGTRLNNSHETLIWATKSRKSRFTFNYKTAKELNVDAVGVDDFARGVRKQMGSIWRFPVCSGGERLRDAEGRKLHSTQKPLGLLERVLMVSTVRGDLVLDPFGGTMTTAVAAKKLGRRFVCVERDERYCSYGLQRVAETVEVDSPLARAVFDVKPLRVPFAKLVEDGYLVAGEGMFFKGECVATLLGDGRIDLGGEVVDIHSGAARVKGARANRLNGFDCWFVLRDGELVSIADVRERYRADHGGNSE